MSENSQKYVTLKQWALNTQAWCEQMEFCDEYGGVAGDILELLSDHDRYKAALEKIEKHGCCVMHNDVSCPGCLAKDILRGKE